MKRLRHAGNSKDRGFSLIELLIAMMIIMVSMLALLTTMLTSINANVSNEARNTATIVANLTAEALLALPIDDPELTLTTHNRVAGDLTQTNKGIPDVTQKIRNYQVNYGIQWQVAPYSANLKQVNITVTYQRRGQTFTYSSLIYKHRAI